MEDAKLAKSSDKGKSKSNEEPKMELDIDEDDDSSSVASFSTEATGTSRSDTPSCSFAKSKKQRVSQRTSRIQFKYSYHLKEDHGQAIFGAAFYHNLKPNEQPIFATVGANRVTCYRCNEDGTLSPLFVHADPDTEESFYSVAWSYVETVFVPVLAFAGHKGLIRVVYIFDGPPGNMPVKTFTGHGSSINELKFHPSIPTLLVSASKDHGLRLWDTNTTALVAMFGGAEGHRDEVLGVDIKLSGDAIISCGMDHSLKIWRLDTPEVQKAIRDASTFRATNSKPWFKSLKQHYPDFTTRDVHHNYVDCVAWHGNSVVSKSCEHDVKLWRPGPLNSTNNEFTMYHEINVKKKKKANDVNIWFLKFSFDFYHKLLAVGDGGTRTVVYDIDVDNPTDIVTPAATLTHPKCISTVRVTAFNFEGTVLITTCDDGTLFRWDRT